MLPRSALPRLALTAALLAGCRSRAAAPPPPAVSAPATPAPAAPDAGEPAEAPAAAAIPEADVRALVAAWADAQNRGDFDAYARLYAARFEGVRRSGPRTRRFARAGWLEDRRAMFRAGQRVEAADVRVEAAPSLARVTLTQSYAAGTFSDRGPKQLVVVREGDALRIAREEMLSSEVARPESGTGPDAGAVPGSGGAASARPEAFMLAVNVHGLGVVLAPEADDAWGTGAPRLIARDDQATPARRAVDPARLPAPYAAMRGRRVRMYGPAGAVCAATVGEPVLIHRVDVHFGTEQQWDGQEGGRRASDARVARDSWGMGDGGLMLFAPVRADDGGACADALWARAEDQPEPPVFVRAAAPAALAAQAVARFRATPAYRTLQQQYVSDAGAAPNTQWVDAPAVHLWEHAASGRRYVTVHGENALGGCAEFSGALWSVFEVRPNNALVPRTDGANPGAFEPLGALDADNNGEPDFIVGDGLLQPQGDGHYGITRSIAVPNLDCGC